MNKERLVKSFEKMMLDDIQRERIFSKVVNQHSNSSRNRKGRKQVWFMSTAVCAIVAVLIFFNTTFSHPNSAYAIHVIMENGASVILADVGDSSSENKSEMSYVDARPELEFYINDPNIAKIDISTKNEYIYAVDWTETQDRKFWDVEYYQTFDSEEQTYVADFDLLYDKKITMNFDEEFVDHADIWYRWTAWDMYKWAAADNFSHFLGYGIPYESRSIVEDELTEEEKLEMAAGSGSGIGHMQLDDYPDHLKEDTITIKITDRKGNVTTKAIHVKISNNELGQTIVTAKLIS